jgi:hypothetical protein
MFENIKGTLCPKVEISLDMKIENVQSQYRKIYHDNPNQ